MTIDQYRVDTKSYVGSFTMVFSRSECGVKVGGVDHGPLAVQFETPAPPTYPANPALAQAVTSQAPLPGVDGSLPAPSGRVVQRGAPHAGAVTSTLPSTTVATSPTEHTTASETSTSAPPDPSGEDGSTTSGKSTAATSTTARRTATITSTAPTSTAAPTSANGPPATQVTTSTSAAPATAIPDAPGTLSPAARIEEVGIVNRSTGTVLYIR